MSNPGVSKATIRTRVIWWAHQLPWLAGFWLIRPTGLIARMAWYERLYSFFRAGLWYAMGWRRPT